MPTNPGQLHGNGTYSESPQPWKTMFPSLSAQELYTNLWLPANAEEALVTAAATLPPWENLTDTERTVWVNFARMVRDRVRNGAAP